MTDKQDVIVKMYQEVIRFFDENSKLTAENAILKKHTNQFTDIVADIVKFNKSQEYDSTGFAEQKKEAKLNLANTIFNLTSSFCSFAIDTNNKPILNKYDLTLSIVKRLKDAEFVNYANNLLTDLTQYVKELQAYHITDKDIKDLKLQIANYSQLLLVPAKIRKQKSVATDKIKELIKEASNLLDNSIDRDMVHYKDTQEIIYLEYLKDRQIDDSQTAHLALTGIVVDATTNEPLQDVKVRFRGGSEEIDPIKRKVPKKRTTAKGNYQFKTLPLGKCEIEFTLPYYQTQTVKSAIFANRKTILDIKLVKE